jgi:hypothetical protein
MPDHPLHQSEIFLMVESLLEKNIIATKVEEDGRVVGVF